MTAAGGMVRPTVAVSYAGLLGTIGLVGALWTASSLAFAPMLSELGFAPSYNDSPTASTFYYAAWCLLVAVAFKRTLANGPIWQLRQPHYIAAGMTAALFGLFATTAPILLPTVTWQESWPAPDILLAVPAYFVPKSVDILFQQMLVVVMVVALARGGFSLRAIIIACVLLFGGTHTLLALGGMPLLYVVRFTLSASLFALLFPYLILRVPNGFLYSYGLHWTYYAATLVTARTISPYVS